MCTIDPERTHERDGFGLTEVIVTLGIISIFLLIFVASLQNVTALRSSRHRAIATNLVRSELEAIRSTPFAELTDRANAPFMNVVYPFGAWQQRADATAPTQPNSYETAVISGNPNGLTGVAVVPIGQRDDATFESRLKVLPSSPADWYAGLLFRFRDRQNYYWARIRSTDITLGKVVAGVSTTLFTKAQASSTNTWYRLTAQTSGSAINLSLGGTLLTVTPVTDTSFTSGWLALAAWEGAGVRFDETNLTSGSTTTWSFDAAGSDAAWERPSPADLPAGAERLTIADAVPGETGLKRITLRLEWMENTVTKSVEVVTYVAQGGLSQ